MERSGDLPAGLPFGEAGELFTSVVESLDDAVITKTLDGRILSWNPAAERLYGYAAEEVLGKDVSLLIPPGRESESTALIERVRQGAHTEPYRTVRRRKDGDQIEVMLSVSPVRYRGTVVAATILAREISDPVCREIERRQLFSRFSGLFHLSTT